MSFPPIPSTIDEIDARQWQSYAPYYADLEDRPLHTESKDQWLTDWSDLSRLIWEVISMIYIEKSLDTSDGEKEQAYLDLLNNVVPQVRMAEQRLKQRLLDFAENETPIAGLELVLRNMRSEAALYREENIPLQIEESKLDNEYDKITGSLKAAWDGEERNLSQLEVYLGDADRAVRRQVWQTISDLWLGSRSELNQIYADLLHHRQQIATNAGLADYRQYAFQARGRFDYTPEDCLAFHEAIEAVVVPATNRILTRRRAMLGYEQIRPWDWIPERTLLVDANASAPLRPYQGQDELIQGSLNMFNQLDPQLGRYFATMAEEGLLDLDTRQGKALGGYCSTLPLRRRPFIFMNGTGQHDDVQTMLHEAGHAFHVFEGDTLPLVWQLDAPMEFCEVASMAMELLAAPNLERKHGGFYAPAEAARARIEHLEGVITFLPYMAVVDAFQHWVYTHPDAARASANLDAAWDAIWQRFIPGVDFSGFEASRMTGWQRKPHIFGSPFYYIEYGMASIGAVQVWRNSLADPEGALRDYRQALALGGTQTLPQLFAVAGADFRFDTPMLTELIGLLEETIAELEKEVE